MSQKQARINLLHKITNDADLTHDDIYDAFGMKGGIGFYILSLEPAKSGSTDSAIQFLQKMLPGWGWRIMDCCVSSDAFVFPDFNCPIHGKRLANNLSFLAPDGREWSDFTDIDLRPSGNPARALLMSTLTALIALEPNT